MTDEKEIHERPSQFTQDASGKIIVGLNQTTVIPRVPNDKMCQWHAYKCQQLSEKHKAAEDLNKMIHNPDTLERLLNELVDFFHQPRFLAVIVNLFNEINAGTCFAVNIKKNSSGTTSLELQQTQNNLTEGINPSKLPASTRKCSRKVWTTTRDYKPGPKRVNSFDMSLIWQSKWWNTPMNRSTPFMWNETTCSKPCS